MKPSSARLPRLPSRRSVRGRCQDPEQSRGQGVPRLARAGSLAADAPVVRDRLVKIAAETGRRVQMRKGTHAV
jgi:hypothetical protein